MSGKQLTALKLFLELRITESDKLSLYTHEICLQNFEKHNNQCIKSKIGREYSIVYIYIFLKLYTLKIKTHYSF